MAETGSRYEDTCLQEYEYTFRRDLFKGKVAFITGGATGIGFRICELWTRHGGVAAIASRNAERLQRSATQIESSIPGARVLPIQLDLVTAGAKGVEDAVQTCLDHFGRVDLLVNCAAGNFLCPAEDLSFNAFRRVCEVDTFGTFACSKAVFHKFMKKHGGNIINITTTIPWTGDLLQTHVGVAKAGIEAMARHLANEWGRYGIRVNNIAPGPIEGTEGFRKLGESQLGINSAGEKEKVLWKIPSQRYGTMEDIGNTVLFLASKAAGNITGETIVNDGGAWMTTSNLMAHAVISKFGDPKDLSGLTGRPRSKL